MDKFGDPDVRHDLETFPWPWETGSVERVVFCHSLEHMGSGADTFIGIMKELYRVCAPGAEVLIKVPHFRHDDFANDPTHVRIITSEVMELFSKKKCEEWRAGNFANSPLAVYHDVDFEIVTNHMVIDPKHIADFESGVLSQDDIMMMAARDNNVIKEIHLLLRVIK